MPTVKTVTSALTAAALVTGISLAWAQTEDQSQPTNTTAAPATLPSEQTPADPNAVPVPVDNTSAINQMQQPAPADDPSRTVPPADSTATPMPSDSSTATTTASEPSDEPAPRADRH